MVAVTRSKSKVKASSLPPLLALPAELRNTIYHLAFTRNRFYTVDIKPTTLIGGIAPRGLAETALLQACSQIRAEASSIFYANSRFRIVGEAKALGAGGKWLEGLDAAHVHLINELIITPYMLVPKDYPERYHSRGYIRKMAYQRHAREYERKLSTNSAALRDSKALIAVLERSLVQGGLKPEAVEVVTVERTSLAAIAVRAYSSEFHGAVRKWKESKLPRLADKSRVKPRRRKG